MKRSFLTIVLSGLALINVPVMAWQAPQQTPPATTNQTTPVDANSDASVRGKAILQAARKSVGEETLKKLQDVLIKSESKLAMLEDEGAVATETIIKLPNKLINRTSSGFGDVIQAYNGQIAWHKTARGLEEYNSGNALNEFRKAVINETLVLLSQAEQPGFRVEFQKEVMIGDRRTNLIVIKPPFDYEISLYVDAASGEILRKTYRSTPAGYKFDNEENYSDFREVAGLRLPFKRSRLRNGQPYIETIITGIKVNTGATDSSFDKPVK